MCGNLALKIRLRERNLNWLSKIWKVTSKRHLCSSTVCIIVPLEKGLISKKPLTASMIQLISSERKILSLSENKSWLKSFARQICCTTELAFIWISRMNWTVNLFLSTVCPRVTSCQTMREMTSRRRLSSKRVACLAPASSISSKKPLKLPVLLTSQVKSSMRRTFFREKSSFLKKSSFRAKWNEWLASMRQSFYLKMCRGEWCLNQRSWKVPILGP